MLIEEMRIFLHIVIYNTLLVFKLLYTSETVEWMPLYILQSDGERPFTPIRHFLRAWVLSILGPLYHH